MIYVKIGLNQDTLVIDYYHPAVHYPNRVNYFAQLLQYRVCQYKAEPFPVPAVSGDMRSDS